MARPVFRFLLAFSLAVIGSIGALAQASVFEGREASIPWTEGRACISIAGSRHGFKGVVRHSMTRRIELAVFAGTQSVTPGARILIIRDLHPLSAAVDLAADRISLLASLFFGPVGVDIGRSWGREPGRWASVWFAPHPQLTLGLGVEEADGRVAPEIGFRWRPAGVPGWSIGFHVGRGGPSVSIGVRR